MFVSCSDEGHRDFLILQNFNKHIPILSLKDKKKEELKAITKTQAGKEAFNGMEMDIELPAGAEPTEEDPSILSRNLEHVYKESDLNVPGSRGNDGQTMRIGSSSRPGTRK